MGNADYLAAFLHVLLPLAFEVTIWGVPPQLHQGKTGPVCVGGLSLMGLSSLPPHPALPAV